MHNKNKHFKITKDTKYCGIIKLHNELMVSALLALERDQKSWHH